MIVAKILIGISKIWLNIKKLYLSIFTISCLNFIWCRLSTRNPPYISKAYIGRKDITTTVQIAFNQLFEDNRINLLSMEQLSEIPNFISLKLDHQVIILIKSKGVIFITDKGETTGRILFKTLNIPSEK